ncbi:hypothetical protein PM082_011465 [Marasmius tenuissimus]|nr:hypothetical protein PM082_011465 [Marasmius tenuissimus]
MSLLEEDKLKVRRNKYDSDGIDDEFIAPGSDDSDKEEAYWGSEAQEGYIYDSESEEDVIEEYQSDDSSSS